MPGGVEVGLDHVQELADLAAHFVGAVVFAPVDGQPEFIVEALESVHLLPKRGLQAGKFVLSVLFHAYETPPGGEGLNSLGRQAG